jgi:hypothetical protein
MAAFIQSGMRLCGNTGYFTATDTDWNLTGSSGLRTWAKTVSFLSTFPSAPSVNTFVTGFSILPCGAHKLHVGVASVTTTSFQLQITTWDECQVIGVSVGWVAFTN